MDSKNYISNLVAVADRKEKERGIGMKSENKSRVPTQNLPECYKTKSEQFADSLDNQTKLFFNAFVERMIAVKPTIEKQNKDTKAFKRELVYALYQANIRTEQKLELVIDYLRLEEDDFVTIGKIVKRGKDYINTELERIESRKIVEDRMKARSEEKKRIGFNRELYKQQGNREIKDLRKLLKK